MVPRIVTFFLFVFFSLMPRAHASDTLVIREMKELDSIPLIDFASYYEDKSGEMSWREVSNQSFKASPERPFLFFRKEFGKKRVTLWFKLTVQNAMNDSAKILLMLQQYQFYREVVIVSPGYTLIKRPNYFFTTKKKSDRINLISPAAPGEFLTYLICLHNPYENLGPMTVMSTQAFDEWSARFYKKRSANYLSKIMFLGVIAFITLHTLAQYLMHRRKEFLWYAFYTTSVILLFLHSVELQHFYDLFFSFSPYLQKYAANPLFMLVAWLYLRFAREFVDFKTLAPRYFRVVIWSERLILVSFLGHVLFDIVLNNYAVAKEIFFWLRVWLFTVAFVGVFLLFRTGRRLLYFFAIGTLFLALGLTLSMVFWYLRDIDPLGKQNNMWYMQIGMLLELLCFTSGLSYKSRLIEKDKLTTQQRLIAQLNENRRLQEELGSRLEARAKEQTARIVSQQHELETEKEKQLTLEFTKKIAEMELQLLKSQLNPHFYFNTLNNLYGLAKFAPAKASDAILKLSDIMEYVIYDCRHDKVSLCKEINFLQSYIELEKLRYNDDAQICMNVTGDSEGKTISPMLLIQFVENAFKHGLEKMKTNSFLQIDIDVSNGSLVYESANSISRQTGKNGGIGLNNVRKRLDLLYAEKHDLQVMRDDNEFRVKLKLTL